MMKAIGQFLTDINPIWLLVGFAVIMVALWAIYTKFPKTKPYRGQLLVISGFCLFTLLFFLMSFDFKVNKLMRDAGVTASTIPRTWAALMVPCAIMVFVNTLSATNKPDEPFGKWQLALGIGIAALACVFLFEYLGYYLSTVLFLLLMMFLLRERRPLVLILLPVIWCVFVYLVFDKLLYMGLPTGALFAAIFG